MREAIKDKAFQDKECTCNCGNKHEYYGGKGYTTLNREGYSDGNKDGGYYRHEIKCNQCGEVHTLQLV